jgi:hypothetical protein
MMTWRRVLVQAAAVAMLLGLAGCISSKNDQYAVPVTGVVVTNPGVNQNSHVFGLSETLPGGTQAQLTATVSPANATNPSVFWASSNPSCYTVDQTGLVKWVQDGTARITATTVDGGFMDYCDINATDNSSCPFVFVGDGNGGFNYLTDLQGPIIGMPAGNIMCGKAGLYTYDQVVLDGLQADPLGNYQVKIREVQAEITYLDEAKLLAVDVPDGYTIASSSAEQTYGNGYVNPPVLYTLQAPKPVLSALDQDGNDVTAQLAACDGVPAPSQGVAPPSYTLDFGSFDATHAKLVICGWPVFSPAITSSQFVLPSVDVQDGSGNWVQAKTFGLPAGDEKTMVIDLSNLFPSTDRHVRLNLGSRAWVRWAVDSVQLDDSAPVTALVGPEVPAAPALLSHPGSATVVPATLAARGSVLDNYLPVDPGMLGQGWLTRLGDVTALVSARDDEFVIMGSGDEILLSFSPGTQPPAGYQRFLVLKVMQYYKAFYDDIGVDPLPFSAMTAYPYPATEQYPDDAAHQAYLAAFNTRLMQ